MAIGQKEWIAKYDKYTIRVVNTWLSGAKLYINGEIRAVNDNLFEISGSSPSLSAHLDNGEIVEVFVSAVLTTKAKICVNGEQIGGDVF